MTTLTSGVQVHTIAGGGDLRLHVREWGEPSGAPILFIHGWSQNHLCWARQYESPLAQQFRLVAFDLRGHGMSAAPLEPENYTDGRLWADDVAAIVDALSLRRAVLVGWSYGGFVICDYVRAHGQDHIAAINFVGAAVTLGPAAFGTLVGPGFIDPFADLTDHDLGRNIAGVRNFVHGCVAGPLSADVLEAALCWNMAVPARVRAHLASREIENDDVLRSLEVPVLVTHDQTDTVILPAMAEHILATCRTAEASWYDGTGHLPQLQESTRFNRELAELTRRSERHP